MKKSVRVCIHILVWLLLFANNILPGYFDDAYIRDIYKGLVSNYFIINIGYFSTTIFTFYFTALIIAPAFLKKKWLMGVFYTLLFFIASTVYRYIVEFYLLLPITGFHNYKGRDPEFLYYVKNNINYVLYSNFIYGFAFHTASEWYKNNRKQKELEKEKIRAELSFLKSQINPHFLFNTLNDIYTLTYQKSDLAPNALLKLSDLLRYMIKDSMEDLSLLKKEIDYLKNFIELHAIGQKGNVNVDFRIDGVIDGQKIAPLILINFVENAFKHGVIDNILEPIKIKLIVERHAITFSVYNTKNDSFKDDTVGIGLTNVKRRLDLIYLGKHRLEIEDIDGIFKVELRIELR